MPVLMLRLSRYSASRNSPQDESAVADMTDAAPGMLVDSETQVELDFHDLSFFMLEMFIDRMHEAIREFLHFVFRVAQLVLGQRAGRFQFLRFVQRGASI